LLWVLASMLLNIVEVGAELAGPELFPALGPVDDHAWWAVEGPDVETKHASGRDGVSM